MPTLSVIVTIYKVEAYLQKCIQSILDQTYRDMEIILVDDGSPDRCPQICDEYGRRDPRIRVVHQENQGSVSARWNGFRLSKGEYVSIVDGDDWLDPEMYEQMIREATEQQADVVVTGYRVDSDGNSERKGNRIPSGVYRGAELEALWRSALYSGTFYEPGIVPSLCNKIIRRTLLSGDFQPIDPTIRMGDDAGLSYPAMARAKSIAVRNEQCSYHYRKGHGSLSTAYDEQYFDRMEKLITGLQHNLAGCPEMAANLPYYALFMARVGIYSILAQKGNLSLQKQRIERAMEKVGPLIRTDAIDWSGFQPEEAKRIRLLTNGKTGAYLLCLYGEKVLRRAGLGKGHR